VGDAAILLDHPTGHEVAHGGLYISGQFLGIIVPDTTPNPPALATASASRQPDTHAALDDHRVGGHPRARNSWCQ
jgi:hypothetical protein